MQITRNSRGATLVETMASVLIFLLVGTSILQVCLRSAQTSQRSQLAFTAYNLAKSRIEELRNIPFSSLTSSAETDTAVSDSGTVDPDGYFSRTTTVTTSYTSDSSLTQVVVAVDYQVKGQLAGKPMTLTTVIYQYA